MSIDDLDVCREIDIKVQLLHTFVTEMEGGLADVRLNQSQQKRAMLVESKLQLVE